MSWRLGRLELLASDAPYSFVGGPFGSKLTSRDYVEAGVPVIRGSNMNNGRYVDLSEFAYVSESKVRADLSSNLAKPLDLVFTQRGTLGQVAIIPKQGVSDRYVVSQSQMKLTVDATKADRLFLYYFFSSRETKERLASYASSSGVPHINLTVLRNFEVPVPPLAQQRHIVSILCAYDDLVENNRRRIQLLEQSARLLYREWFVHFRFPGHERVNIKNGVPQGWSVSTLGQVCLDDDGIQTGPFGSQLHQSDYSEQGIPVVMPRELAGNKIAIDGIARVPEEIAQRLRRHLLRIGDTIYGRRGDIGRRAYIGKREAGWLCGTGCLRLRPDPSRIHPRYFFDALGSSRTEGTIIARAQGATMPNLNATIMRSVEMLVPSLSVQTAYVEHINPLDEQISALGAQNEKLTKARDLLLPRLMSGELKR